jgi:hypothetical protein
VSPPDTSGQKRQEAEQNQFDLSTFKEKFEKAKFHRSKYEPDWYLNLSYFVGDQWVFWNANRLDRPRVQKGRVLLVDNRILGIVMTRIARKTKSRPAYVATPFSGDESDIASAKLGEKVLESDWHEQDLLRKLYTALLWAEICSAGFWKVYWDPMKGEKQTFLLGPDNLPVQDNDGRPIRRDQVPQELMDPAMEQGYQLRDVAQGSVQIEAISPFEFYPDPLATTIEDCEWAVECKVRSQEYVRDRYGKKLEPDSEASLGIAESRLWSMAGTQAGGGYGAANARKVGVKVFELWQRPCSDYEKGIKVCWAGDTVLDVDEGPFDPMPYVKFDAVEVPGRFWPTNVTTQARGPQTDLNKLESQIQESAQRIGNPSLLWSRFNGKLEYQGLPGETIYYDGTAPDSKPGYLQPPEMPVYVQNLVEQKEQSLQEISGLHEVSKATVPAGVTAASAINLLQEADDTRLGPEVGTNEVAIAQAGTKSLKLYAAFADEQRLVRLAGEDGDWDVFEFRGAMLGSNTNVEVQAGSMMPRSKAAKMAAMTELFGLALQYGAQVGLSLEPRNVRRFFKDYEAGAIDRLFANIGPDEQQITWENRQLARGVPLPINWQDNDDLHIEGHEEFAKSPRYRRLPPEVQQMIALHVQQHRQRRMFAQEAQAKALSDGEQQRMMLEAALRERTTAGANGGGS